MSVENNTYFEMIKNRIGRFKVPVTMVQENPLFIIDRIMSKMIILKVDNFVTYFEYTAISSHFPVSPSGDAQDLEVVVWNDKDNGNVVDVNFKIRGQKLV